MPLLKLGKREKLLVSIIVPLLVFTVFYLRVYKPKSKDIKKAGDDLAFVKNQYQIIELQEKLGQKNRPKTTEIARRLRQEIEQAKAELSSSESNFPRKNQILGIFREITDLAANCGVEIISFKPGAAQSRGMYEVVPIEMSLRAQYFSLAKFLEGTKKFPLSFDFLRLDAVKTDLPNLKIELKLAVYTSGD